VLHAIHARLDVAGVSGGAAGDDTPSADASGDGAIPTRTWCRRHMAYAAGPWTTVLRTP